MTAEISPEAKDLQPQTGIYQFLVSIGEIRGKLDRNTTKMFGVIKEEVCGETGGSCIDVLVTRFFNYKDGTMIRDHLHVTDTGEVVRRESFHSDPNTGQTWQSPNPPDIESIINEIRELLEEETYSPQE